MESMKRVDVLKSIEQILVQKAYETGHISHRADGDWQKTNNGWVCVKGSPAQPAPDTDDSAERAEYERQLTEEQNRRAEDDPTGYGYEEPPSSGKYGEITEEDLIETPEVDLYDADQVDLSGYANNINIDGGVADNDDLEDVANQILLDNNLEVNDENMNKARDAMLSWLDANGYLDSDEEDYEQDDEVIEEDSETTSTNIKDKAYDLMKQLKKSGVNAITESENADLAQQIGLDADKAKEFFMKCGVWVGDHAPDGGWEEWDNDHVFGMFNGSPDEEAEIFGDVEKSAVRDMRSAPVTKNMGF